MSAQARQTSSEYREALFELPPTHAKPSAASTVLMFLGQSNYWWAYLGVKSNPKINALLHAGSAQVIFFDDPRFLPQVQAAAQGYSTRYVFIFWDGLHSSARLHEIVALLPVGADLTALVVGDISTIGEERYNVQNLFPPGDLAFNQPTPSFDTRTERILVLNRIKNLLMPLKNISHSRDQFLDATRLALGRKRLVFCGVFGSIPAVIREICQRHQIDFNLFADYPSFSNSPDQLEESYLLDLSASGQFLADLYDRSLITEPFFLTVVHLLGREYFIRRIRAAGLAPFINGYGIGRNINVNVYGTPFYSQHVFLDFGSQSVGSGNYPRLANLRYFRKKVFAVDLGLTMDRLLRRARAGALDQHFHSLWQVTEPALLDAVR